MSRENFEKYLSKGTHKERFRANAEQTIDDYCRTILAKNKINLKLSSNTLKFMMMNGGQSKAPNDIKFSEFTFGDDLLAKFREMGGVFKVEKDSIPVPETESTLKPTESKLSYNQQKSPSKKTLETTMTLMNKTIESKQIHSKKEPSPPKKDSSPPRPNSKQPSKRPSSIVEKVRHSSMGMQREKLEELKLLPSSTLPLRNIKVERPQTTTGAFSGLRQPKCVECGPSHIVLDIKVNPFSSMTAKQART